jgi:hypothetical protein
MQCITFYNCLGEEKTKRLLLQQPSSHVQSAVAFYAYISHLETVPGAHHMVVFDVVKTNIQGGYNGNTGVFTVPIEGVYVFTYNVRVACHSAISFEILKNSTPEGSVYIDTENSHVLFSIIYSLKCYSNHPEKEDRPY